MLAETVLDRYPLMRTRDVEELHAWMRRNFSVRKMNLPVHPEDFNCVVNHCALSSISLTYARYGAPLDATLDNNNFFLQGFPLSGAGVVQWNQHVTQVDPAAGGIAGSPGAEARFEYSRDFSNLILKITPAALVQRLSVLIERPIDPPLKLTGVRDPARVAALGRLVAFLACELQAHGDGIPPLVVAELEDAILLNFLFANQHNYSEFLEGASRALAPWQVRRVVDFIEQHWDEPISIEQLTRISETSSRSLFLLFKKTYDMSPMVYLSQVRLRHAKELLSHPSPGMSVTKVGFMCGFSNMGNFAMKYYGAFGEKPSDTLRSNRR